jgi:CRISPR-associated protein Cmr6
MPNTPNLGLQYYRNYFGEYFEKYRFLQDDTSYQQYRRSQQREMPDKRDDYVKSIFQRANERMFATNHPAPARLTAYASLNQRPGFFSVRLKTTYPGLLVGTGYNHDFPEQGVSKIGFFFDHTTGLPIIPGSSVKGLLRASFPGQDLQRLEEEENKNNPDQDRMAMLRTLADGKSAYLRYCLREIGLEVEDDAQWDTWIAQVEAEVFTGAVAGAGGRQAAMSQRFVCHDAVIVDSQGRVMAPDVLTPHKAIHGEASDQVAEPNPIPFVKVIPGTTFQFTFQATDEYLIDGVKVPATLRANELIALCKKILLDRGAGAKTNVGYGQFEDTEVVASGNVTKQTAPGTQADSPQNPPEKKSRPEAQYFRGRIRPGRGLTMEAVVITGLPKPTVKVFLEEGNTPTVAINRLPPTVSVGDIVLVTVQVTKKKEIPGNIVSYLKHKS